MQTNNSWPHDLSIKQVRIARPTDNLEKVVQFYTEGLGLEILTSFKNHEGYDGVMIGLPGLDYHLEFTSFIEGSPCPAPTKDNLLVLYFEKMDDIDRIVNKFHNMGYPEVEPENPYWIGNSVTIEDPDGWRIVLFNGIGLKSLMRKI